MSDDALFDVMWCRPGLTPFRVAMLDPASKLRVEHKIFGTLGLSLALAAEGHDVICPIVRSWRRSGGRHRLDASPVAQDRALWPSYVVVRWKGGPSPRVRRWFATKVLGWGTTAGNRWTAPAGLVERWRGLVADETAPPPLHPPAFFTGQLVDVVDGPWRGVRLTIRSAKRGRDGAWIYECDLPRILTQILSMSIPERDLARAVDGGAK